MCDWCNWWGHHNVGVSSGHGVSFLCFVFPFAFVVFPFVFFFSSRGCRFSFCVFLFLAAVVVVCICVVYIRQIVLVVYFSAVDLSDMSTQAAETESNQRSNQKAIRKQSESNQKAIRIQTHPFFFANLQYQIQTLQRNITIQKHLTNIHTTMDHEAYFEQKLPTDLKFVINFIMEHPLKNEIINMYQKGPPPDRGFLWTRGTDSWWTPEEGEALEIMRTQVLRLEWESSGYGFFQRKVQAHFNQ